MNDNTQLAQRVARAVETRMKEEKKEVSLTEIEQTTRMVMQEISREVVEVTMTKFQAKYVEQARECECGAEARYVRHRPTQLYTIFGKVKVKRAYYLCAQCRKGHCPLDQQLGLRPNALSAELERIAALTGVQVPYQKGSELLEELTLLSISDQTVAKASRAIGRKVIQQEERLMQVAQDVTYLQQQERTQKQPLRLYGAIDATKVHIRGEEENGWRDLKVGAWFEACGKPPTSPDGEWRIVAENIEYYTDICPAREFSPLVWATAVQRDANLARELIILGDGAEWIWNLVDENFPHAIQILDWFHACEHLTPVAHAAFSDDDQRSQSFNHLRQLLWDGDSETLIATCRSLAQHHNNDDIRRAADYFETHIHRIRYPHFRKQGYQIGSGTIESAAKQIGMMRMKVPGAHWNQDNAVLVAKARASYLSNRWQDLPLAF